MPHFKILGWLWLVFGLSWSILVGVAVLSTDRWDGLSDTFELGFFIASTVIGLALLRRWYWAQAALGALGGILLAISVLLSLSPRSPSAKFGTEMLLICPLFGLSLYSQAVVLVPFFQGGLSRRSRALIIGSTVVAIVYAVSYHIIDFYPPGTPPEMKAALRASYHSNFKYVRRSVEAFITERKAKGLSIPANVTINDLALQGYLSRSEAAAFSNTFSHTEATVFLNATDTAPGSVRIRLKSGDELVLPY